jgi:CheY-like chemotaxis protein
LSQPRARILAVDDEPAVVNALRRLLSRDYQVTPCTDPEEALRKIVAGERFDAILCDLRMPGLSGMELYERVVALDSDQGRRMIFITASAQEESTLAFVQRVGNPCLAKPVAAIDLRRTIAAVIGASGARR